MRVRCGIFTCFKPTDLFLNKKQQQSIIFTWKIYLHTIKSKAKKKPININSFNVFIYIKLNNLKALKTVYLLAAIFHSGIGDGQMLQTIETTTKLVGNVCCFLLDPMRFVWKWKLCCWLRFDSAMQKSGARDYICSISIQHLGGRVTESMVNSKRKRRSERLTDLQSTRWEWKVDDLD